MKYKGHYIGTEIDSKWWKRYQKDGFFARGNGDYWFENDCLFFRKLLTQKPLCIPASKIKEISKGNWHAGKWTPGQSTVKVIWTENEQLLSSGFSLRPEHSNTDGFFDAIHTSKSNP